MSTASPEAPAAPVRVMYVGRKPFAVDNVASSGATWEGRGTIQEVSEEQASALVRFPDQWMVAPKNGKLPSDEAILKHCEAFYAKGGEALNPAPAKEPKDRTLAELQLYVKKTYGVILRAKTKALALKELADIEQDDEQERGSGTAASAVKAASSRKSAKKR